jgi:integrase
MAKIRLAYVHEFADRHGTIRRYFRRRGSRIPLPGLPGSREFSNAYARAFGEAAPLLAEIGASRTLPGSINAMAVGYVGSTAFHNLAPTSQTQYRRILEDMRLAHGDKQIAKLERRHVVLMLDAKAETPSAARDYLRCLRLLVQYAIKLGVRDADPTVGVRVSLPKSGGFRTWSEDDIAAFELAYPIGSKPRLALALLLGTALRCADVVRVGRGNVRNGEIYNIRQQKTGTMLPPVPITAALATAINAMAPNDAMVFLLNEHGRAFTAKGFGKWFTAQCQRIGLHGVSPHGLRKAACRRLAEAGCSANEIAAISGHSSLREVERYTKAADQARMARNARAKEQNATDRLATLANIGKPEKNAL